MAFCRKCGNQMGDREEICPTCGTPQERLEVGTGQLILWGIVSFCIPLVGIVLYFSWKKSKPSISKVAGIAALVSIILNILLFLL